MDWRQDDTNTVQYRILLFRNKLGPQASNFCWDLYFGLGTDQHAQQMSQRATFSSVSSCPDASVKFGRRFGRFMPDVTALIPSLMCSQDMLRGS